MLFLLLEEEVPMKSDLAHLPPKHQVLELLFTHWNPAPQVEEVPLLQASGRVLAEDQFAQYNLPVVRASTMDGIAVRSALFAEGIPDTSAWVLGEDYVRADTGDDFDDRFDAVIAIENVTFPEEGGVCLTPDTKVVKGSNVKPCGADVKAGSLLVPAGRVLRPQDAAAIAMGGSATAPVWKRPRVGFLPTGSELVPAGAPLCRGQNFDSNSIMTAQLLEQMGAEPVLHPICQDDPAALEAALHTLLPQVDILLINAGTSKGGEDYCATLLEQSGQVLFHGVAAVPGRPMSMAMVQGKPVVNLSGPSFACFYSLDWAVRAMICRYYGLPLPQRQVISATLTRKLQTPPIFSMMSPFQVEQKDGIWYATPVALRGPGAKGSAAALTANAVYISALREAPHEAGEQINLELTTNSGWLNL